jgi:hypothetical protein
MCEMAGESDEVVEVTCQEKKEESATGKSTE